MPPPETAAAAHAKFPWEKVGRTMQPKNPVKQAFAAEQIRALASTCAAAACWRCRRVLWSGRDGWAAGFAGNAVLQPSFSVKVSAWLLPGYTSHTN